MRVAKEAPIRERVSRKTPTRRVVRVPWMRVRIVARGETKRAWEIERPPTKAKSRGVAPGKVEVER